MRKATFPWLCAHLGSSLSQKLNLWRPLSVYFALWPPAEELHLRKPKSEHTFGEYPLLPPHGAGNFFAKKGWFLVMVLRGSKTSGYSLENTGISCLLVGIYTQSSSWLPRLNNSPSNSSVGRRIKNSAGKNQSFGVKYPIVASFPFIPKWRKIDVQRPQYPEWINPQLTESWSRDSYP